jgi:SAM-dependent methyltransferase
MAKDKKKKKKKKPKGPTKAELADRHALYQSTVQSPEADCEFFETVYKDLRGKAPLVLREDFCGTANISCVWVESGKKRRAIGVDLDGPTLDWGREHNLSRLGKKTRERVELHQADVLDGPGDAADITCAMNFSYCVFKTRDTLLRYFQVAQGKLADDGIFVCELYGGTEAIVEITDEREYDEFDYEWEQAKYNPITAVTLCHIHFRFDDGSRLDNAFTYDWRLWTIPELRELLTEAGFSEVMVYWEGVDDDGEGTGEFLPTEEEENQESWLVYIVAAK